MPDKHTSIIDLIYQTKKQKMASSPTDLQTSVNKYTVFPDEHSALSDAEPLRLKTISEKPSTSIGLRKTTTGCRTTVAKVPHALSELKLGSDFNS